VTWRGAASGGARTTTTEKGIAKRTESSQGVALKNGLDTAPAELIAAAHASSFSLSLFKELGLKASAAGEIAVKATVTLKRLGVDWTIMNIHLGVLAELPKVTQGNFIDAAIRAKANCFISRLLRTNISMTAKLKHDPLILGTKTYKHGK
jgi:osmotically inducible protein OsmC